MSENLEIGGLRFDGVKVERSETKTENGQKVYCVWTDAGYMEYGEQKRDKFGESTAVVHKILHDIHTPSLFMTNMTNGRIDTNGTYSSIGVSGGEKNFTINTENDKKEIIIMTNSEVNVKTDQNDVVRKHQR